MTTKKKRTRLAVAEPTAKTHQTKVAKADTAAVEEPPRTEPGVADAVEHSSALASERSGSGAPLVNETEVPAQIEAAVEAAATAPTASPEQSVYAANKLSALDAAAKVLAETGQAMSCAELIAAMAAKGYWSSPKGKTPASTLYAALQRELQSQGEQARFRKAEPGKFTLRTSQ